MSMISPNSTESRRKIAATFIISLIVFWFIVVVLIHLEKWGFIPHASSSSNILDNLDNVSNIIIGIAAVFAAVEFLLNHEKQRKDKLTKDTLDLLNNYNSRVDLQDSMAIDLAQYLPREKIQDIWAKKSTIVTTNDLVQLDGSATEEGLRNEFLAHLEIIFPKEKFSFTKSGLEISLRQATQIRYRWTSYLNDLEWLLAPWKNGKLHAETMNDQMCNFLDYNTPRMTTLLINDNLRKSLPAIAHFHRNPAQRDVKNTQNDEIEQEKISYKELSDSEYFHLCLVLLMLTVLTVVSFFSS